MNPSYESLVRSRTDNGQHLPSRYGPMREELFQRVIVQAGEIPQREGLNTGIGFVEMLQLIAGVFDHDAYARVAPNSMLHLFTENGAYGPRVVYQLRRLIPQLSADPSGRQHILYVAASGDQYTSDMPCTNSLHFFVRGGRVHLQADMRSSDVVKGLPYDVMMFGGLNMAVARAVGLVPGLVSIYAASSHIYEDDVAKGRTAKVETRRFRFTESVPNTWPEIRDWAEQNNATAPWDGAPPTGIQLNAVGGQEK